MDGVTPGRTSLLCTLLLWTFQICSAELTVKVTPEVEVMKGETAKLPCTYTGAQSSSTIVEWYIEEQGGRQRVAFIPQGEQGKSDEDTPLTGRVTIGKDFTLTITSVKPSDELTFYCQVTAGPEGSGEDRTMLKVFFTPENPELVQPSSQAITAGLTTSSEIGICTARNGHPQPRIIWFKNNEPLPQVKDKKEKTYMSSSVVKEVSGLFTIKSILFMQPTKADKDAVFHCTVEYSMLGGEIKQKMSNTMKINLNYPSEKATFHVLNSSPVKEGDNVTMKCETDGNPQPSDFEYKKNDKLIIGQEGLLTLKSVKRTDSGEYSCHVTDYENLDADLRDTLTLTVNYIDPMSVTPNKPQVVMLGDKVEWQCKTKASKQHTVQWIKGSEVLSQDGTLSIDQATFEKAGEYVCVGAVSAVPGLTAQANVNLTVKGKPMIEPPAPGEVMNQGDTVTLKCSAYGFPTPQFVWTPSGNQRESVSMEGNKIVSTVTLQATGDVMENGVTCEASNEFGTDSKKFPVSLKRAGGSSAEADKQQGGSTGVVIAVVVCVLLLLLLVALIYFLSKKAKLPCSKKDPKEVDKGEGNNKVVVEMKTEKPNEQDGLLKNPTKEQ
ncbi:basal cell adhesion molecule isoform X2 [Nematolebias whitei]|uniref:basal cell adhesion molecule isoform X2 n=1 Tax=Nematolebias whitei TaxID=451745 RepID=UPI0018986944|nr:basal cell adhesion molecule isoform X2 [Nematolebias whitei]